MALKHENRMANLNEIPIRYAERLTLNNIQVGGLQMDVGVYALPGSEKMVRQKKSWVDSGSGSLPSE